MSIKVSGVKEIIQTIKNIKVNSENMANSTVRYGKLFAVKIAPHDTGALRRAIRTILFNKKAGKAILRLQQPKDGRGRPYHMWHHNFPVSGPSGKGYKLATGKYSPKSGDPMFMVTTAEAMSKFVDKQGKNLDKPNNN